MTGLTNHNVLVGAGTATITNVSPSTAGFVLTSNGLAADPSFQDINTLTYYSLTPYIVGTDVHSQYTTIQSAITQAVADGATATNQKNVYIKPGTYNENLTGADGVNLISWSSSIYDFAAVTDSVSPSVNVTGSLTATAGKFQVLGIKFAPAAGNVIVVTGASTTSVTFSNCEFLVPTASLVLFASGANAVNLYFENCSAASTGACSLCLAGTTGVATLTIAISNSIFQLDGSNSTIDNASSLSLFVTDSELDAHFVGTATGTGIQLKTFNSYITTAATSMITGFDNTVAIPGYYSFFTAGTRLVAIGSSTCSVQLFYCKTSMTAYTITDTGKGIQLENCFCINAAVNKIAGTTSFNGSGYLTEQGTSNTTDATVTTLASIVLNELESITVSGQVTGAQSNHTNAVGGTFNITARRASGGNITLIGAVNANVNSSSAATFTADVDVGTQSVRIRVTGVAATTYNWVTTYNYQKVLLDT